MSGPFATSRNALHAIAGAIVAGVAVLVNPGPALAAGPNLTCEIWPIVNGQAQRERRREMRVELPDPAHGSHSLVGPSQGTSITTETQLYLGALFMPMPNGQTVQRALLFNRPAPGALGETMIGVSYAAGLLDGNYLNLRTEAGQDGLALTAGEIGGAARMGGICRR